MIDLHMHTINSDGSDKPEEILKKCEELELEYISITDHDTCKSYEDLKNTDVKRMFTGKIIPGCEFTTIYQGRVIEILGYGIDTDKINKWANEFYTEEIKKERKEYSRDESIKKLQQLGIEINKEELKPGYSFDWSIYDKLVKEKEENEKILGKGMLDDLKNLFRYGFSNPNSPLYVDVSMYRPTPKEITDLIHEAGGKTFLAHAYQYAFDDILEMITNLRKECDLDGVEAFHSSFTLDQIDRTPRICKEK